MKKKKIGFALGAGGSRGVAHIGFLKAMEEGGVIPHCISGCSMGAVVGSAYASGMAIEDIYRITTKLKFFDLFAFSGKVGGGFIGTQKIRALLVKYLGDKEFSDLNIPFGCIATDIFTQSLVEFTEGKVADAVVASASIPGIFTPTVKDGKRLIDGGVLERVPVKLAKKLGADVIIAVDVLGYKQCRHKEKCPSALTMMGDAFDILDNREVARYKRENADIIDAWIEPDLGDMSPYTFKNLHDAYERGYEAGAAHLKEIKKIIG